MNIYMAKKMVRKGRTKVIYKGTFISKQSLQMQKESTWSPWAEMGGNGSKCSFLDKNGLL